MAERKAVIKNADMSEDMQQDAVDCASQGERGWGELGGVGWMGAAGSPVSVALLRCYFCSGPF